MEMRIEEIHREDQSMIKRCVELADRHHLENIVVLGDLHPPCIHLTRLFACFQGQDELPTACFVVFGGFRIPAVAFSSPIEPDVFRKCFEFLTTIIPDEFVLPSFGLHEDEMSEYCTITERGDHLFMVQTAPQSMPPVSGIEVLSCPRTEPTHADEYFKNLDAYAWHPMQAETGFYRRIEQDGKTVACGGTHFETPQYVHLGNIHVLPEYRRRGYAIAIVLDICQAIILDGRTASLFVETINESAISLYEKLGFEVSKPANLFVCQMHVS